MDMATVHSMSAFNNSCLSVPRSRTFGTTSMNYPKVTSVFSTTEKSASSPSNTQSPHPITSVFNPGQVERNDQSQDRDVRKEYAALFSTLQESNSLLLEEIQSLQQSHQITLCTVKDHLNESRVDKKPNTRVPQSLSHSLSQNAWVGVLPNSLAQDVNPDISSKKCEYVISDCTSTIIEDIEPTEGIDSCSDSAMESPDDESDTSLGTSGESHSTTCSREPQPHSDPFASSGSLAIEGMWDNFSVDEYPSYKSPDEEKGNESKQWTPKITIPKPFSMTLRESQTPKRKSRGVLIAEQEKIKKIAQEEAELMKKIHATPVPASTFLPLYELVNAKNEQRKRDMKILSKEILKSNEKPFKFMKREQSTKEFRTKQAAQMQKVESEHLQKRKFKAKPIPKHLFDPKVNEHLLEQEEYRKIRIQMRSKELLARSKLPGTMHSQHHKFSVQADEIVSGDSSDRIMPGDDFTFQPTINRTIPDYDRAYYEFQKKLDAKKKMKCPTQSKPFRLQTQDIPSRKQHVIEDIQRDSLTLLENRWPFIAPRAKVSRKSPEYTQSKTMLSSVFSPAKTTETTRLRQSLTQTKLNQCLENEVRKEQQRSEKRQRKRSIQQSVAQKSILLDPTLLLEEKNRKKLQEFRMLDKMKLERYQQKLSEINERVQARPLLLEQASHAARVDK